MCLLGIETCFTRVSVALCNENVLKSREVYVEKQKSETLAELVKILLKENGKSFLDITDIYVNAGPGSFTGIRTGLSFVEGVSFSLPLIKKHYVTSFACVLGNMEYKPLATDIVCVLLKAIGETFYMQTFDSSFNPLSSPIYISIKDAEEGLVKTSYKLYGNFTGFFKSFQIIEDEAVINASGAISCHKFSSLILPQYQPVYIRGFC